MAQIRDQFMKKAEEFINILFQKHNSPKLKQRESIALTEIIIQPSLCSCYVALGAEATTVTDELRSTEILRP